MENPILGGGYTCSECGQYQRTSAVCKHFNLIDTNVKHNPNMKTREEIEKLANEEYKDNLHNPFFTAAPMGYIKGYTKCQEEMVKDVEYWQSESDHWHQQAMEMSKYKYTEEDVINLMFMATKWDTFKEGDIEYKMDMSEFFKYIINSLNKQD
jgi:hypothetical protein